MDEKKRWAKVHANLLKEIIDLYAIDRFTLIKTSKGKKLIGHWLSDRFPPSKYRDYVYEVLREHILGKKDSAVNKQMTDIIKNKYIDLYNDVVGINDPDTEMGEYISVLLRTCYIKGKEKPNLIVSTEKRAEGETGVPPTPTGIDDTLDPGLVAPVPYSDD